MYLALQFPTRDRAAKDQSLKTGLDMTQHCIIHAMPGKGRFDCAAEWVEFRMGAAAYHSNGPQQAFDAVDCFTLNQALSRWVFANSACQILTLMICSMVCW
jgi:hypothetical protein